VPLGGTSACEDDRLRPRCAVGRAVAPSAGFAFV
jgi:hypothetical protein